jgi:hypothetical protein
MRRNQIRTLEVEGDLLTSHDGKTAALTAHLLALLSAAASANNLDVRALYAGAPRLASKNWERLVTPFTELEVRSAVKAMNRNNSPSPNGFGPGFYTAAWTTVSAAVMDLAGEFHRGVADLERLNRSYIVMTPKSAVARRPGDFCPICLENCSLKITSKMLTTRLQTEISKLIDVDQTGFIHGLSISKNFIYAMELIQCCNQRKLPTLVLKLDFAKAFASVDWGALTDIMLALGFPRQWCRWIAHILTTTKLAVLVNSAPDRGSAANGGSAKGTLVPLHVPHCRERAATDDQETAGHPPPGGT